HGGQPGPRPEGADGRRDRAGDRRYVLHPDLEVVPELGAVPGLIEIVGRVVDQTPQVAVREVGRDVAEEVTDAPEEAVTGVGLVSPRLLQGGLLLRPRLCLLRLVLLDLVLTDGLVVLAQARERQVDGA